MRHHLLSDGECSVLSNACQVLTLGARVVGPDLAKRLVIERLGNESDPGTTSAEKVAVITEYVERSGPESGARHP